MVNTYSFRPWSRESEETRFPLVRDFCYSVKNSQNLDILIDFFDGDISEMVAPSFVYDDFLVEMFVGGKTLYRMVPTDIMKIAIPEINRSWIEFYPERAT